MRILLILILLLQACSSNKVYQVSTNAEIISFWEKFEDKYLNDLVKEGLKSNNDILIAMVNVNKAQSALHISEADRLPRIDLAASGSKKRDSENMKTTFFHRPYNSFFFSAVINYQIDLWGKMANANKSAREQLLALDSTKKSVQITIASEISKAYFNIIALDNKISIYNELLSITEKLYDLQNKKFKVGNIDNIELNNYASQIHMVNSQLLDLKQQLVYQETSLKILLGRKDFDQEIIRSKKLNQVNIVFPGKIPSKLLLERPDILAAEHILKSAKYNVKVARADYFPEISLSNFIGFGSNSLNNLFKTPSRNRGILVESTVPVIDFGRTKNNVEYTKEVESQSLIEYQQTVRIAFGEAINSLSTYKTIQKDLANLSDNEKLYSRSFKLTEKQFKIGFVDYISVIESQKRFLYSKIKIVNSSLLSVDSTINIFKTFAGNIKVDATNS
ncbi:MAG: TolC family protein [Pseudomonadota bacterium]